MHKTGARMGRAAAPHHRHRCTGHGQIDARAAGRERYGSTLLTKDEIKEELFDILGPAMRPGRAG
jgi:hypothetical protein